MQECINPGFPVYFSYAGNNDDSDIDLENEVKKLRALLVENYIDFRDYKISEKSPFNYSDEIVKSEREIGEGQIIVVVFSEKYVNLNFHNKTSLHCMYEWHCIVNNKDYEDRICPVFVDDRLKDRLKVDSRFKALSDTYQDKYDEISRKEALNADNLDDLEKEFLNTKGDAFRSDLNKIRLYLQNHVYTFNDLNEIVKRIKKRIKDLIPEKSDAELRSKVIQGQYLPTLNFDTRRNIVPRDAEAEDIMRLFEKEQIVNMIGVGGCGKTTITECFVNKYNSRFGQKTGLFINHDFYREFSTKFAKIFGIENHNEKKYSAFANILSFDALGRIGEKANAIDIYNKIIDKMEKYPQNGGLFNLLIIDINEFADYDVIEQALDDLRDNKRLKTWKILVVSREKMESARVHFSPLKLETDKVDFFVLKAIFDHYLKDDRYDFTREQLEALFLKLGHLPILIEHLAYFLKEASDPYTFNSIIEYLGDGFEDEKMWNKKYDKIRDFLSKLMRLDTLDEIQNRIVKQLVVWPAEYYSAKTIRKFISDDEDWNKIRFIHKVDIGLNRLVDKCVLDVKDELDFESGYKVVKRFKIHDIISDQFKIQIFEEKEDVDVFNSYIGYLNNIERRELNGMEENMFVFCLSNYIITEDEERLLRIAKRYQSGDIYEIALKIKALKIVFSNDKGGIKKLDGSNRMSVDMFFYNLWKDYALSMPSDGIVNFKGKDGKAYSFRMIKVFGGSLCMGFQNVDSNATNYDKDSYSSEGPVHYETLRDFFIGAVPVTQGLWKAVMGEDANPSRFKYGDDYPVECVSWYDCINFIMELNKITKYNFLLPTEVQWEYAARGGRKSNNYTYSGSNHVEEVAWYYEINKISHTQPVGVKRPNELGIYDMSGNVYEWCQEKNVIRGGAWCYAQRLCSVSYYNSRHSACAEDYLGFRLALIP